MPRRIVPILVVSLSACKPTNADLTSGSYTMFLSRGSPVIFEGALAPEDFGEVQSVDCRPLEEGRVRLKNPLDVCQEPFRREPWLGFDGYYVIHEELSAWRGEAIVTNLGDLQLTFHHRLPNGEDFRFAFVVAPGFQPRECRQRADGEGLEWVDRDGPWLESWSDPTYTYLSEDWAGGGTVFFPNAASYQFNPGNTEQAWVLPQAWRAGYTVAKWSGEELVARGVRYGLPELYVNWEVLQQQGNTRDLFWVEDLEAGADTMADPAYKDMIARVERVSDEVEAEYARLADAAGAEWGFRPVVYTNQWRPYDGSFTGLDGWVELHYNWIRFDQGPDDLQIGNPASGQFQLFYDARESQSRVFLEGTFVVDRIKRDRWTPKDIHEQKLQENETELCGVKYGQD